MQSPHRASRSSALRIGRLLLGLILGLAIRGFGYASDSAGNIAIYRDDIPAPAAAAVPEQLAGRLERAGFATDFLTSEDLASSERLNRTRFDVLVLPYGPSFPVAAADNFRKFLAAGGKFFSTGGYAFDDLFERTADGWRPYQPPLPPRQEGVAWFYDLPAAELRGRGRLTFRGWLKSEGVAGPGFAHFSVYQVAADQSLPTWRDLCQVRGATDWTEYTFAFEVHPQAATVSLRAGLYRCRGTAWFDGVRLTDAAGNVLLESAFEEAPEADRRAPRNWWRSDPERCAWQTGVAQSGAGALKATLGFAIPRIERLNTRHGQPEDGLEVEPTQLGVFQADYPLERATFMGAAPGQSVVSPDLTVSGSVGGWAACGVVGWDSARWIPLVNAYDRYGRLRGAAGGLLRHYAGTWGGSSWAFFGVTNQNLFSPAQPTLSEAFVRIIRALVTDTYFASLGAERACYRQGEGVTIHTSVFNGGRTARDLRVTIEIRAGEPEVPERGHLPVRGRQTGPRPRPVTILSLEVSLAPGQSNVVTGRWTPKRFGSDFYQLIGRLTEGTNELDQIESGFVVWDEKTVASGPRLEYRDNYLRFGGRPLFQFGTDDWGYVFNTSRETPLQWLKDMRLRRDLGVTLYENLQFGLPRSPADEERLGRKVDGVVQLAQKHGQVYFAGLLIGYNAAASDAALAAQRAYCGRFAERYAEVPGLVYYLNGDYRCELSDAVTPHWNSFLREQYGSDSALREAWGAHAPTERLGAIPAVDYHDWEQTWDDVSAYDRNRFRAWLLRRWNAALIAALREHDPTHPTSGEFYQLPHGGVDLPAGVDGLDLANFGFFEKPGAELARFPALCKLNDQRARGKSSGPGEYGVKTHPAWGDGRDYGYHTARTREQAMELFLTLPHLALGLGASRMHNWCWKDDAHRVFPWGLVYPCDGVPKDTAYVHRNLSLLFRHFAPVYQEPEVFVLTPDCHRMGGAKWQVTDGILTSIDLALATHVHNLGTLNEEGLEIPRSARVLFYPVPYCLSDSTYQKLLRWVTRGGVLYLSGDLSYDEQRRGSRAQRLPELCGVRRLSAHGPPLAMNATNASPQPALEVATVTATVLRRADDGTPWFVEHRVGSGRVFYSVDPLELHRAPDRRAGDVDLYRRVLAAGGVAPLGVQPDLPELLVFKVALRDGGRVWIVCNREESQPSRTVTLTDTPEPVTFEVAPRRPALLWYDGTGALRAVEAPGECRVAGQPLVTDETGGIVLALDGKALPRSEAVLLMPLRAGQVAWASSVPWRDPRVETGDFHNGRWRMGETLAGATGERKARVQVTEDQALSLLLFCEKRALPRWRGALERAMKNPGALP